MEEEKKGILVTISAYMLWGILPIYWKTLDHIPAFEVLAHRIVWALVFMGIIILLLRKQKDFLSSVKDLGKDKKALIGITLAAFAISANWFLFIWAVNSGHVIQASLGYYINPLISIMLGMLVMKETFTKPQWFSFLLAGIGVAYMTINVGAFPWVSIALASSFAIYGLLKKLAAIPAIFGLTVETMIVTPLALIYLIPAAGPLGEVSWMSMNSLLVFSTGAVTAIPLLLFTSGTKRIPLSMVGFLQYIAPTLMLLIGVFLYQEPFTHVHLIAFSFIWAGLFLYTSDRFKRVRQYRKAS
ncbi:EamA family transporter RarD [Salimicrobium halophilum]|uniref:Chloramphenicol-sensitive protein RarD n=1 Tax=Salimicrobium halophilum TaxID=86666 RepID=A0A1G8SVL4_9BACI|nr:EamA family transporter RarD [Salimicrobium halophilum]SDJ32610.1 chloramphenicol-sensitive protein RarD [Salimicrobium halophilum]